MSTFGGLMKEYNLISIDRFDGCNLDSTMYMLSHNHSDHTVGLLSSAFQYRLASSSQIKLYCSMITRQLLLLDNRYKSFHKSIVALDINSPHLIDIPDRSLDKVKDQVTVTLLQAGHCPGSVMFLFEGNEGTALYTGDFRLSKEDFLTFDHLKSGTRTKVIQSLYIDTTFCIPQAMYIPSREECTVAAFSVIREWLDRGPEYIVLLQYRADLGYENLFVRISIEFDMKIHVDDEKFKKYENLADLVDYLTTDASSTRIHACKRWVSPGNGQKGSAQLPCGYDIACSSSSSGGGNNNNRRRRNVRRVLFSTMCFVHQVALDAYTMRVSDTFCRVCYSFHSSYSEIRDAVVYLQPKRAFPNVIPTYQPGEDEGKMQQRLTEFVELAERCDLPMASASYRELGQLRKSKARKVAASGNSVDSLRLVFNEDDSDASAERTPSKRPRLCTDSIDLLAEHHEHRSAVPCGQVVVEEVPKFRLLFGSSQDSVSSSSHDESSQRNVANDVCKGGSQLSAGTCSQSPYKSTKSDVCGMFDGMTQDDRNDLNEYLSRNGPLLSYISDEEEDGPSFLDKIVFGQIARPKARAPVCCCKTPGERDPVKTEAEREIDDKSNVKNVNEQNTCSGDQLCISRQVFSQENAIVTGDGESLGKDRATDGVCFAVKSSNSQNTEFHSANDSKNACTAFVEFDACQDKVEPHSAANGTDLCLDDEKFDRACLHGLTEEDAIVINDDDDCRSSQNSKRKPNDGRVTAVTSSQSLEQVDAQPLDSDATVDLGCSPVKLPKSCGGASNRATNASLSVSCNYFDSDATTTDTCLTPHNAAHAADDDGVGTGVRDHSVDAGEPLAEPGTAAVRMCRLSGPDTARDETDTERIVGGDAETGAPNLSGVEFAREAVDDLSPLCSPEGELFDDCAGRTGENGSEVHRRAPGGDESKSYDGDDEMKSDDDDDNDEAAGDSQDDSQFGCPALLLPLRRHSLLTNASLHSSDTSSSTDSDVTGHDSTSAFHREPNCSYLTMRLSSSDGDDDGDQVSYAGLINARLLSSAQRSLLAKADSPVCLIIDSD